MARKNKKMAETAASRWSTRNDDGTMRWSWHIIENYLTCPRKYKLAVVDDVITTDYRQPLALGTAVHRGLAAAYRRLQRAQIRAGDVAFSLDERQRGLLESEAIRAVNADDGVCETDKMEAERIVRSYCQGGISEMEGGVVDFDRWRILRVEDTIYADLKDLAGSFHSVPWSQTPDLVVEIGEYPMNGLWIPDHKTAARLNKMSLGKFYVDGQALALVATARAAGIPVRGFIANMIVKTKQIQFAQQYVEFEDHQLVEFATNIAHWQRTIRRRVAHHGPWPRNYHACIGQYGYCDYYDLCRMGPDVDASSVCGYGYRGEVTVGEIARELEQPFTFE